MENLDLDNALYLTAQTGKLDQIAMEQMGVPGYVLMERAGQCAFDWIAHRYPNRRHAIVLCGPGNNGGDGYVVARLLLEAGIKVSLIQNESPKTKDAITARNKYLEAGGSVTESFQEVLETADLIVDGLLGAGLNRAPTGQLSGLIEAVNCCHIPVVALDLPSGVSGDSGRVFTAAIEADSTVTFIGKKIGSYTGDGVDYCGEVQFESLDLKADVFQQVPPAAHLLKAPVVGPRRKNSHKGQFGHVVVAGGDYGMIGAVQLAGRAALRTGCGMVTVLSHQSHLNLPALVQAELMSAIYEGPGDGQSVLENCSAIIIGPGTSTNSWGRKFFDEAMRYPAARVIDAGGLRMLPIREIYFDDQVLTPHPGEAAALLECSSADIQMDRVGAARKISQRYGGVCVLKGAGSIISDGNRVLVCDRGNPGMASAGMGDVLSGIIGAQLGKGRSPWEAACAGVWWHSIAADRGAEKLGAESLLASDVIGELPATIVSCLSP